jgi:hypothetical protein
MSTVLTDKQRQALDHIERARSAGKRLSDYARVQGVGIRAIYDGMAALRKKGVLAPAASRDQSAFVAVRVEPTIPSTGLTCRLRMGAVVIECAQWPPAAWVKALALGRTDAAA